MGLDNPIHILILLLVVLLVFGAKRLPEIGRSLGDGMRGFKDSLHGETDDSVMLHRAPAPTVMPVVETPAPAVYVVPSERVSVDG